MAAPAHELISTTVARLIALPRDERLRLIRSMTPKQQQAMLHDWRIWARPKQLWKPGPEKITAYLTGRGWGKNEAAAHIVHQVAENPELCGGRKKRHPGDRLHGEGGQIGIAGRTANDVNETILYGPSGIMTTAPPWAKPKHLPSRRLLVWPNGCVAHLMSADVPETFRGKNLGFLLADELAFWRRLKQAWMAAMLALRRGEKPRVIITTTPQAFSEFLEILFVMQDGRLVPQSSPDDHALQGFLLQPTVRVVQGSTYENAANLPRDYFVDTVSTFEGTELGDQELRGMILFQRTGAIWKRDWIKRIDVDDVPDLVAGCIAIDPTISDGGHTTSNDPCECGLVAIGMDAKRNLYLLDDASGVLTTKEWAVRAWDLAIRWQIGDFAYEYNQGGDLIRANLVAHMPKAARRLRYHALHATKDKASRAGLVAPLWSAGQVFHVDHPREHPNDQRYGHRRWTQLEHQQCTFDPQRPKGSQRSDRMDAAVWGAIFLRGDGTDRRQVRVLADPEALRRIDAEVRQRLGIARQTARPTRRG